MRLTYNDLALDGTLLALTSTPIYTESGTHLYTVVEITLAVKTTGTNDQ